VLLPNINSGIEWLGIQSAFNQLRESYPAFEFLHGGGLGVLSVGGSPIPVLCGFLPPGTETAELRWRKAFARLGRGLLDRHLLDSKVRSHGQGAVSAGIASANGVQAEYEVEAAALRATIEDLRKQLAERGPVGGAEKRVTGRRSKTASRPIGEIPEQIEELRKTLADTKRRLRAQMRGNTQLRGALRDARQSLEEMKANSDKLKSSEKQAILLRNDIAGKASALTRMGNRIAKLKEEIKRNERYVEKLTKFYNDKRARTERRVHSLVKNVRNHSELEALRETILRHEGAPALKMLTSGVSASLRVAPAGSRSAVYLHYRVKHARKDAADLALIAASGLFDPSFYLSHYEDVAVAGVDPLIHYMDCGAAEHRDPSPYFDTQFYLEAYPDIAEQGLNPLLHFIVHGRTEGRTARRMPSVQGILGDWTPPAPPPPLIAREVANLPKRAVIYTAVSGGYDDLQPPAFRPPGCDFVVFSDQPLEVSGWEVRPLNYLHPDPTRAARFAKLHPHLYFPDYEHSIWIDANINVHGDIREFFPRLSEDIFLGIFVHPHRDCVYVEGEECIKRKKDDPNVINGHTQRYRELGFPEKSGLWETNVLVRHHNNPRCIELMNAWWHEMQIGSRRDQISLPFVVKKLSAQIAGLAGPKVDARNHPQLSLTHHRKRGEFDQDTALPAAVRKPVDLASISMDVGVCVYNSLDETRACLESVVANRRPNDCIVIVDDASAEPTAAYLDDFVKAHDNVKLVRHESNRGYTASANDALKASTGDWVVLLNSDAVVARGALAQMVVTGEQFPQVGIVGPLSNAASWQTVPQLTGTNLKFLVNEIPPNLTIDDMNRVCRETSTGVVPFVPLVNGFCYAVRRKLIEKIGYFDEEAFPQGYGEEDDYCLRAGAEGFLCAISTDAYVFHVKSATFTSDRRKSLVEAGVQALERKHTPERLRAAVATLKRHPELRRIRNRIAERLHELSPPPALTESQSCSQA
jgi:GT2 family glycosyltransferase